MKLNLGCGKSKLEGFIGVDVRQFDGGSVEVVCNLGKDRWPFDDDSCDEAVCSHMLEHLAGRERIHFFNELWRVLRKGAKCQIVTPHWASTRAYGDVSHQWPPVCEFFYYYLSASWRKDNAPHDDGPPDGYCCDFEATWGYSVHPALTVRNAEYQQFALSNYKEAAMDMAATVTARK